jgi:hypothetical protein
LLLVTHLLRPGPTGALAAVELVIARRSTGTFDLEEVRRWAGRVRRSERLERVLQQAAAFDVIRVLRGGCHRRCARRLGVASLASISDISGDWELAHT